MTHGELDNVAKIIETVYDQAYRDGFHTAKDGRPFESGRQWRNQMIIDILEGVVWEGAE